MLAEREQYSPFHRINEMPNEFQYLNNTFSEASSEKT